MAELTTISLRLDQYCPPDCAARIEDRIEALDGVQRAALQPVLGTVRVEYYTDVVSESALRAHHDERPTPTHSPAGTAHTDHTGHEDVSAPPGEHADHGATGHDHHAMMQADKKRRFIVSAIVSVPLLLVSVAVGSGYLFSVAATFVFGGGGLLLGDRDPGRRALAGALAGDARDPGRHGRVE